ERYQRLYQQSIHEPEAFWTERAQEFLDWTRPWDKLHSGGFRNADVRWFEGGRLNVCVNCVDRHLESRAQQTAIIWEGDNPEHSDHITYQQLYERVNRMA